MNNTVVSFSHMEIDQAVKKWIEDVRSETVKLNEALDEYKDAVQEFKKRQDLRVELKKKNV